MEAYNNIYDRYSKQINNCIAPGMASNKIAIFVDGTVYTEEENYHGKELENYVNNVLIPWAFMNGIYLTGITHGNFVVERSYRKPEEVVESKFEDYDLNVDVLNYVFGVMAATTNTDSKITVIIYCGEADHSYVQHYNTEEEFYIGIKDDLEYLEEE